MARELAEGCYNSSEVHPELPGVVNGEMELVVLR